MTKKKETLIVHALRSYANAKRNCHTQYYRKVVLNKRIRVQPSLWRQAMADYRREVNRLIDTI